MSPEPRSPLRRPIMLPPRPPCATALEPPLSLPVGIGPKPTLVQFALHSTRTPHLLSWKCLSRGNLPAPSQNLAKAYSLHRATVTGRRRTGDGRHQYYSWLCPAPAALRPMPPPGLLRPSVKLSVPSTQGCYGSICRRQAPGSPGWVLLGAGCTTLGYLNIALYQAESPGVGCRARGMS